MRWKEGPLWVKGYLEPRRPQKGYYNSGLAHLLTR